MLAMAIAFGSLGITEHQLRTSLQNCRRMYVLSLAVKEYSVLRQWFHPLFTALSIVADHL